MPEWIWVGLGGFIGAIARFFCVRTVQNAFPSLFPFGTLAVNIGGCLVLAGFSWVRPQSHPALISFLVVGILGAFTTFSAFSYDTVQLFREGHLFIAIANIVVSVLSCVGIVWLLSRT